MILLLNIGNTNLTCGLYDRQILASDYCPFCRLPGKQETLGFFERFLQRFGIEAEQVEGVILASVVPERTERVFAAAESLFHCEPFIVSSDTDWEMDSSAYSGVLGTDRLLCCSAALRKFAPPLVVVDFGTATTLNVIDAAGNFCGGAILPGVTTGLRALAENTSQLPELSCERVPSAIGTNTRECILSGATLGAAYMLEGFVRRFRQELGSDAAVVVTGGNARDVLPYVSFPVHYQPELLLQGLAFQSDRLRAVKREKSRWA